MKRWQIICGRALFAFLVPTAGAQIAPAVWTAVDVAHVEVNGQIDQTGALYQSPDGQMTLIVSGRIGDLILFELPTHTLRRVSGGGVQFGEGTAQVSDSLRTEPIGTYSVQDAIPVFRVDSLSVRMVPKTLLTGEVTPEALLRHSPEWGPEMRFYEPYGPAVAALWAQKEGIEVVAVFSATCGRCRAQVPKLMRVAAEVNSPNLKVRYLAVPGLADSTTTAYHVWFVPTFIVLRNGKEIGRIVERPRVSMEEDLVAILRGMY